MADPIKPSIQAYHVEFQEINDRQLPVNLDRFKSLDQELLFFDHDLSDAYWVRIVLPNDGEILPEHILSVTPASLHHVDMYIPEYSGSTPYKSISRFSVDTTPKFSNRSMVFEIPAGYSNDQEIFFYVHSIDDEQLSVEYWEHDEYLIVDRKQSSFTSAMLASLFVLVLVNLIFFLIIRNKSFLAYVCYLASILLFMLISSSKIYEFTSAKWLAGSYNSVLLIFTLTCICLTIFIQRFLALKKYTPVFFIMTEVCLVVYVLAAILALTIWPAPYVIFTVVNYVIIFSLPLTIYAAVRGLLKGHKQSAYFLISSIPLIIIIVLRALALLNYIPNWEITVSGFHMAVVFQAIVLTIGLSDQMLSLRKELDEAQQLNLSAQQSKQKQKDFSVFLNRIAEEIRAEPTSNHEQMIVTAFFERIKQVFNIEHGAVIYQVDADLNIYSNLKLNQAAFQEYTNAHISDISKICHSTKVSEMTLFKHPFFPQLTKMMIIPVHMRGHEWSGMILNINVTSKLEDYEYDTIKQYSTELIRTLINAHKLKHYSQKAETDDLTQVLNRGAILKQLNKEIESAQISQLPLSIAFLDIDHFKKINDSLGHEAGDTCLTYLSYQIKRYLPNDVYVGRMGGDEFLFIFPNYLPIQAKNFLARLNGSLETLIIEDDECSFTLSIGVAQYHYPELDFKTFLRRADEALYQAKDNGRNQITISKI